jgi:DNA anti-recombination protein RmuC
MERENVLSSGIETLYAMKESLTELEGYKESSKEWSFKEEQTDEQLEERQKAITDEVGAVLKKRRQEIEASFEEQMNESKTRLKKVKSKKEKQLGKKVSERIEDETADLTKEGIRLKQELKAVFQKNHISRVFNHKWFHAVFMPCSLKDFGILLITVLILFLAIPVGIYKFLLPAKTLYLVLDYFVTILVFGSLYILINKKIKENHTEAIINMKAIRQKMAKNHKKIRAMAKGIRKDKDESIYGLDEIIGEIRQLEDELNHLMEEKKNALVEFESTTKVAVSEEVKSRYEEEMKGLESKVKEAHEEQRKATEKVKEFSLEITNRYESYLGKDMLTKAAIERLIEIMKEQNVTNITEALSIYRAEINKPIE